MTATGFIVMLLGAVSAAFWRMWGLIKDAGEKGEEAQRSLAAHKLHAAETFATKAGMQEQTAQLLRAIEGVGNRIDGLHERLDRAFERTPVRRAS
ncbi:hypothetical protein [Mesorhizobium sp. LSHC414A00]|uniref:hypothetical protein n=1 Tax=Mesorhizobium sp. LSHC414A00 TaxID=1287287 RepID=UPI001FDAA953|nr:hypothetical protein [Mesorhizobium sp. LSHC414A00]